MKNIILAVISIVSYSATFGQAVSWQQSANNYSTGRLAIGTSTIGKLFEVRANEADHMGYMINSHASGYGLYLRSPHDPLRIVPSSGSGQYLFVVSGTGNVGVGVSSPSAQLHISGDMKLGVDGGLASGYGNYLNFLGNGLNGDPLYMARYNNGSNNSELRVNIGDDYGQAQDLFTVGTHHWSTGTWYPHFAVQASGRVGIGTTSPDEKLAVKGKIHAEEVRVDLSVPGPDYVFDKGYDLPTVDQLKAYIDEHHHLPEVPSAKEMEANGVQLGEMNMLLLKKIEELTLYVIDLKSELDEVKKKVK